MNLPKLERIAERASDHSAVKGITQQLVGLRRSTDKAQIFRMRNVKSRFVSRFSSIRDGNVEYHFLELSQFENRYAVVSCCVGKGIKKFDPNEWTAPKKGNVPNGRLRFATVTMLLSQTSLSPQSFSNVAWNVLNASCWFRMGKWLIFGKGSPSRGLLGSRWTSV